MTLLSSMMNTRPAISRAKCISCVTINIAMSGQDAVQHRVSRAHSRIVTTSASLNQD